MLLMRDYFVVVLYFSSMRDSSKKNNQLFGGVVRIQSEKLGILH